MLQIYDWDMSQIYNWVKTQMWSEAEMLQFFCAAPPFGFSDIHWVSTFFLFSFSLPLFVAFCCGYCSATYVHVVNSSLLQNIGLFCKALLQKRPIFLRSLLIAQNDAFPNASRMTLIYLCIFIYICVYVYIYIPRWNPQMSSVIHGRRRLWITNSFSDVCYGISGEFVPELP